MESKIIRPIFIAGCFVIILANVFGFTKAPAKEHLVRVAVVRNVDQFDFSVRGKYKIIDPQTGGVIDKGKRLKRCTVVVKQGGISIDGKEYGTDRIRVKTKKDVSVYLNGRKRRYRDQVDIVLTKKNKLLVINTLDLESYVKGVLYHEVPHRWPMNAIKAQAVATRTYALYQVNEKKGQEYDVTSDIYSQVYGGRSAERYRTNVAANRTRGQILTYKGKVLPAYFHSNCGGQTENAAELWKHDLPPLKGVKCRFCKGQPNYRWKKNFQSKNIQDKLNKNGYKFGLIKKISIISRTESGRIKNLKIETRDGKSVEVPGVKFREIIGPNVLKSNYYEIEMKGYFFDVNGRGWGHGVGMCQWGNYQMAKKRFKYMNILEYYYLGAELSSVSDL